MSDQEQVQQVPNNNENNKEKVSEVKVLSRKDEHFNRYKVNNNIKNK
jgi:hypothetical protein